MGRRALILLALVFMAPVFGGAATFREILDGYKKFNTPLLYTECTMTPQDKAMLIVSLVPTGKIWLIETQGAWVVNTTQIEIKDDQVDLVDPLGGFYSHRRITDLVDELLRNQFKFLMPTSIDVLLASKPEAVCPAPPKP